MRKLNLKVIYESKIYGIRSIDFNFRKVNLQGADTLSFDDVLFMKYWDDNEADFEVIEL